jgi:hypothetical protein
MHVIASSALCHRVVAQGSFANLLFLRRLPLAILNDNPLTNKRPSQDTPKSERD